MGLEVQIKGSGKVNKQSLNAGTRVKGKSKNNNRVIVKQLKEILYKVAIEAILGTTEGLVSEIAFDSRKVVEDALFCCN